MNTEVESEGLTDDLETWLKNWKLSQYIRTLEDEGIESPHDFRYIKSKQDFEQLMNKLGNIPFMHRQKFKDAWSSVVQIPQPDVQIHFLGDEERKIMDKLYQRYTDISQDITAVQKANTEFNESVQTSKQTINDSFSKIMLSIQNKKRELLNKIDEIHDQNTKIFMEILDPLNKMSKRCQHNKEQFEIIACNKHISSTERLKKLNALLSINMNEYDDDEKKENVPNYDHYKMIGDQCVVPAPIHATIDEESLNTAVHAFASIECNKVTSNWNTKKSYIISINWDNAKKLNLMGGTGGTSGQTKYVVNNIVVESSHPVYTNSHYYWIPYMFDGNTTSDGAVTSMWLATGPKNQTLTFTFPDTIKLSYINAYSYTGAVLGTHKYGIDYLCDNKWEMLCVGIDTRNDALGFHRTHSVQKTVSKVRFNFELISYYISMSEIDFFVIK